MTDLNVSNFFEGISGKKPISVKRQSGIQLDSDGTEYVEYYVEFKPSFHILQGGWSISDDLNELRMQNIFQHVKV
jgi:hypothetical protein